MLDEQPHNQSLITIYYNDNRGKGSFSLKEAYIKNGKAVESRLTFTKIKQYTDRPNLLANAWSRDDKRTVCKVQPGH